MSISTHTTRCLFCKDNFTCRTNKKYCSISCKNRFHQNNCYKKQQERGNKRKKHFVELAGGQCSCCGYQQNYACLSFHHKNPKEKDFPLDLRNLSNRTMEILEKEFNKCELLCLNCHTELHHPSHKIP